MVVEGEKTYINDQLIGWFNQAINCCKIFLADSQLWSTQTQNTEFSVVLMKIPMKTPNF